MCEDELDPEKVAEALDKLGHAPAIVHRDIDK